MRSFVTLCGTAHLGFEYLEYAPNDPLPQGDRHTTEAPHLTLSGRAHDLDASLLVGDYNAPPEAVPLFERTLADSEQILGSDHPHTLRFRDNLAAARASQG
jgi:hypothetical protein